MSSINVMSSPHCNKIAVKQRERHEFVTNATTQREKIGGRNTYRMRPMHNEPLEKDSCNLLFDCNILCLTEEEQHDTRIIMRMARGVAKLVGNSVQTDVASTVVKFHQFLQNFHLRSVCESLRDLRILKSSYGLDAHVQNQRVDARGIHL